MNGKSSFRDRVDGGRQLAARLGAYADRPEVIVLALPRGGVPVGVEVARALHAPLDVMIVRKLGVPGQPELAMGAIAPGGVRVVNEQVVRQLAIPVRIIDRVAEREAVELERRERVYRAGRPPLRVEGRTVILVDDGIATGSTARAAVQALRAMHPGRLVLAAPTAAAETVADLRGEVDEMVCVTAPDPFFAIGYHYDEFPQLSDATVQRILAVAAAAEAVPPAVNG